MLFCCSRPDNLVPDRAGAYCAECGAAIYANGTKPKAEPPKAEPPKAVWQQTLAETSIQDIPGSSLHIYQRFLSHSGPVAAFQKTCQEFNQRHFSVPEIVRKEALDLYLLLVQSKGASHKGKMKKALLAVCL